MTSPLARRRCWLAGLVPLLLAGPAAAQEPPARLPVRAMLRMDDGIELHRHRQYVQAAAAWQDALAGLDPRRHRQLYSNAAYNLACSFALSGQPDAAIEALRRSVAAGFDDAEHTAGDHDLDPLRKLPAFRAVLAELERKQAEAQRQARARGRAEFGAQLSDKALFPFDFTVETLDGAKVRLADLRGKVVLVEVFGSWCGPCRPALADTVALHKRLGDTDLAIVGLAWEHGDFSPQAVTAVRELLQGAGVRFPVALIDDAQLQQITQLQGFPTTLLLDRQGRVRHTVSGREPDEVAAVAELLLDEPPPGPPQEPPVAPKGRK